MNQVLLILFLSLSLAASQQAKNLYNIKLFESFIPHQVADELVASKSLNTTFKSFFLSRQNSTNHYVCALPAPADSVDQQETQEQAPVPDLEILSQALSIINNSFKKDQCLFAYELGGLYWTYAYCYGDKIIQYREGVPPAERHKHHIARLPDTVYVLGRLSDATNYKDIRIANQARKSHWAQYESGKTTFSSLSDDKDSPFSHHSAQKVVLQFVDRGSKCELKMLSRTVEVIYKCDPELLGTTTPLIIDVPEITTCQYKMFIHVPGLCNLEPFAPQKNLEEYLTPLDCQLVDEASSDESNGSFEDWLTNVRLRDDERFPVRADNRIFVDDHYLMPLANGFYFALSKTGYKSASPYYNMRNVVVYNGVEEGSKTLADHFGRTIFDSIGTKIYAPHFEEEWQQPLGWNDSFTLWFELYNFAGEFLNLYKLVRDGSIPEKRLTIQVIDPVTLLDIEGDAPVDLAFDQVSYEAPLDMWNFQSFLRYNPQPTDNSPEDGVKTVTESETVTVIENPTAETFDAEKEIVQDLRYEIDLGEGFNREEIKRAIEANGGEPLTIQAEIDGSIETLTITEDELIFLY